MKIKKIKNKVIFNTEERSDSFNNITKHHLYKEWVKVKSHFKKRGFIFKTQQYHIDNDWGQPFNKVGFKDNGVVVILDMNEAMFSVDIGFHTNLWDSENDFWDDWHNNYKKLSYLEQKSVELETYKLLQKYNKISFEEKVELKGVDFILDGELTNPHIHGGAKSLEDIKEYVDNHFQSYNHLDANKKKIVCGELKYYYDYDRILKKGIVYHNINNMWWVLSGGDHNNVASFKLFDFNNHPRKKPLTKEEKINRLEREIKKMVENRQYKRCIAINKEIEKLKSSENLYKIWSLKHGCWWGSNNGGYTNDESKAGLYLESNIMANQGYYNDGVSTKAIRV